MQMARDKKSIADTLFETHYQTKVASELWLNLGSKEYRLVGKVVRLGRALDNDIVLEDRSCSRYHALITIKDGKVLLEDLKSRNGVQVNGKKITQVELNSNDELAIGDLKGIFFSRKKGRKIHEEGTNASISLNSNKESEEEKPSLIERFHALPKFAKLGTISATILIGALLGLRMTGGGNSAPQQAQAAVESEGPTQLIGEEEVVEARIEKELFELCRDYEDLGNFRRARQCFGKLPMAAPVREALNRIITTQHEQSKARYQEGDRAFKNYYYDLAILKWQEVLIIADEKSKYRSLALEGIRKAEQQVKLR